VSIFEGTMKLSTRSPSFVAGLSTIATVALVSSFAGSAGAAAHQIDGYSLSAAVKASELANDSFLRTPALSFDQNQDVSADGTATVSVEWGHRLESLGFGHDVVSLGVKAPGGEWTWTEMAGYGEQTYEVPVGPGHEMWAANRDCNSDGCTDWAFSDILSLD